MTYDGGRFSLQVSATFGLFLVACFMAAADAALLCTAIYACAPLRPGAASLVATVLLLVLLLFSGFQLNLAHLPPSLSWIADISFARYAFEVMLCGELTGKVVGVAVPGAPPISLDAEVLLDLMGLECGRVGTDLWLLLAIFAVLLAATAAVLALQLALPGMHLWPRRNRSMNRSRRAEAMGRRAASDVHVPEGKGVALGMKGTAEATVEVRMEAVGSGRLRKGEPDQKVCRPPRAER